MLGGPGVDNLRSDTCLLNACSSTPPPPPACYIDQFAAVNLLMEMSDPRAFWKPFFDTLPAPHELVSPLVSLPSAYRPLLQSEALVSLPKLSLFRGFALFPLWCVAAVSWRQHILVLVIYHCFEQVTYMALDNHCTTDYVPQFTTATHTCEHMNPPPPPSPPSPNTALCSPGSSRHNSFKVKDTAGNGFHYVLTSCA
jgi:hypothetical protein